MCFTCSRLREDEFAEMPDFPLQGRQTPMGMVRPSSPGGPGNGAHMSRPRSRGSRRPAMTARSYTDMGIQVSQCVCVCVGGLSLIHI